MSQNEFLDLVQDTLKYIKKPSFNQKDEIILFSFTENFDEKEFLNGFGKAISSNLKKTALHLVKDEKEVIELLQKNALLYIGIKEELGLPDDIKTHEALTLFSRPFFVLNALEYYLKDVNLKKALWTTLKKLPLFSSTRG